MDIPENRSGHRRTDARADDQNNPIDQAPLPADATLAPADAPVDAATPQQWFAFAPSNIALEQLRLSNVSDLGAATMDSSRCEVDVQGESGAIRCLIDPNTIGTVAGHKYLKIRGVDGPLLDVFVARSWTITARTSLPARGLVVLVALEDIVIEGTIDLTGRAIGGEAGDLIPPRVGLAGGPGALQSGSGGGFLRLLAGRSVRIAAGGKITSGGAKGYSGGGGGSGGAILIEAPQVAIAGVVAANGGGGGGDSSGEDATASDIPAAGGKGPRGEVVGGRGSAAAAVDGEDAASISVTAGGGGAAGRIRLNSGGGQAQVTGVVSPSLGTPCAVQGTLRPL